uniref:Carboxylesterase type B domain-containing protein n=2 Tax=Parascaris univalens TaxID=6257 RepID=A0A915ATG3_PARUN
MILQIFEVMGAAHSYLHTKTGSEEIPSRQVKTNYGIIEGRRLVDEKDLQVDAFLGIPFAKPPVGPLRFKKPEPPEPWTGVLKAYKFGARAPQVDFIWEKWTLGVGKDEDCLTLNVFSPAWKPPDDQPKGFAVMVFVHGGGFLIDSAVKYGDVDICRNLCRHDVVVVTIQYRLGLLGFFTTGDEICPGNLGLWDQTLALKWIQENVSAFNGDPNRVTVFGQSAGGASVDLLSLSPHSSHLFQQVIPMAGNAQCMWATTDKRRITAACRRFARKAGWRAKNDGGKSRIEMIDYLRTRSAKLFERGLLGRGGVDVQQIGLDLAPVVDGDFLPKSVKELRKEAPLKKCMIGTCQYEGLLFAALGANHFNLRGMEKLLSIVIPEDKFPNWKELREEARRIYLDGKSTTNDRHVVARAYVELYSDLFVNNGTHDYARIMSEKGHQVFLYSFEYFNPKSFGILSLRFPFKGATHCTELTYLFGRSIILPFKLNDDDRYMMELMAKLWTNFAKYGDPNGPTQQQSFSDFKWEPVCKEHSDRYLNICLKPCMKDGYCERRADFWRKVAEQDSCFSNESTKLH